MAAISEWRWTTRAWTRWRPTGTPEILGDCGAMARVIGANCDATDGRADEGGSAHHPATRPPCHHPAVAGMMLDTATGNGGGAGCVREAVPPGSGADVDQVCADVQSAGAAGLDDVALAPVVGVSRDAAEKVVDGGVGLREAKGRDAGAAVVVGSRANMVDRPGSRSEVWCDDKGADGGVAPVVEAPRLAVDGVGRDTADLREASAAPDVGRSESRVDVAWAR